MKSILFASTALVAFAGAAAAQGVTLSGNAEMGIFGGDGIDTQFFTDIDVTFTMAGETDTGLTFGATVDLDEVTADNANRAAGPDGVLGTGDDEFGPVDQATGNNADDGGIAIFLSGAFGTVTMGDTDGALDWAVTEVNFNSGSLADDETEHAGFNGNSGHDGAGGGDGQIVRYDYTFGNYGVALSAEQIPGQGANAGQDEILGIGFRAGFDVGGNTVNFGIGYQGSDVADVTAISLSGSAGGFSAGISAMDFDLDGTTVGDFTHVGIGAGYTAGAISLSANYGVFDLDAGGENEGFGISAGYDLGGGAIVQFGYGHSDLAVGPDTDSFSLGVRMNF